MLNTSLAQRTSPSTPVTGISGEIQSPLFLQPLECQLGDLTSNLSSMPECSIPLLDQDLLCKLNAQIIFSPGQLDVRVPPEHVLKLQTALIENVKKETELLPSEVCEKENPASAARPGARMPRFAVTLCVTLDKFLHISGPLANQKNYPLIPPTEVGEAPEKAIIVPIFKMGRLEFPLAHRRTVKKMCEGRKREAKKPGTTMAGRAL
ncbi:uncharacterized protein LOC125112463 [Phacochoerus africanus]|uniref:uncharacterized protein LOC125112463 n=1 Tax=Phacochoerus africanus TaxID=41426 RepID=UPI001FD9C0A7|nr:uncharacterized protein LOC125112463 [Phacochoerus africanus]